MHRNIKTVRRYVLAAGALASVPALIAARRQAAGASTPASAPVFLIDEFFAHDKRLETLDALGVEPGDPVRFVSTGHEPSTSGVDDLVSDLRAAGHLTPCAVAAMGGGITLDTAKAVANLFTNPGRAADYQGWDLVPNPGVYKLGIPTISGTGAESSRTCVMTNHDTGLKLGMNSDHTLFDQLILDPDLPATVPRDQYFYTGMDTYLHCVESLAGSHRHAVGDALCEEAIRLCRRVFLGDDMMSPENRERLMTASYLGGCALATGFVGVVHPMSSGLSVVLGLHHGLANCITMLAMDDFYPEACREFRAMREAQAIAIPAGVCANLPDEQIARMASAASLHDKPLRNALGPGFRDRLPSARMMALFRRM